MLQEGAREETDERDVLQTSSVRPSSEGYPDPSVRQQAWSPLWLRALEDSPDVAALVADHGLAAQLQTLLRVQAGEVSLDQPPQAVVKVDPAGVPADRDVTNSHLGPVDVTRGDDRDWHQDLVQVTLQAAGDL